MSFRSQGSERLSFKDITDSLALPEGDDTAHRDTPNRALSVRLWKQAQRVPIRLVVGLDFGTYGTGISYKALNPTQSVHLEDNVSVCVRWPGRAEPPYCKALTALLYKDSQPIAWGWEAWRQYKELDEERKQRGKYYYATQFKLALAGESKVTLPNGLTAVQVIADFLRLFTTFCTENVLADVYSSTQLSASNVQWCLTVPAIWKDGQKDAMRQAAHLAGMIPTHDSDRLRIILEPEAAALHAHGSKQLRQDLQPGTTFMMLDAGGGTVDLTVHTVQSSPGGQLVLEETVPGRGGLCGGTYVDDEFKKWFRKEVGEDVFDRWKRKFPGEYEQVMTCWEAEKRRFKVGGRARKVPIIIPGELLKRMDDNLVLQLEEATGFDDRVFISQQDMVGFFEPCVRQIVQLATDLAGSCPRGCVDRILLAGGFCKSPYLVARLKELLAGAACRDASHIFVPETPESIIMQGAVLAQSGPAIITSRRLRLTYGYDTTRTAADDVPANRKVWDKERNCFKETYFKPLALMGQSVKADEAISVNMWAWSPTQEVFSVTLYTVPSSTARYMDEEGMQALATLKVPVVPGGDDCVKVSFLFGQEEIHIMAEGGQATKERISVQVKYCSNSFQPHV